MKKTLLFISCLLSFLSNAQSPKFEWAKAMGGIATDIGYSVAISGGNVYTTGMFRHTVDFNPDPIDSFNISAQGLNDVFISKLDASGNFVWAKSIGGIKDDIGYSILVDESGNVYITGYFTGRVDFNPGLDTFNLTSDGDNNIFILKLDNNGNFIWAKTIGGTNDYFSQVAMIIDASNNIYITGKFGNLVDFDPDTSIQYNLTSNGKSDIFILKLDIDGNFLWVKNLGGNLDDVSHSIALNNFGEIYITGYFQGNVDFNPDTLIAFNLNSKAAGDMFILKLGNNGEFIWAKGFGGNLWTVPSSIVVDNSGNIYTTGKFWGTSDFNPAPELFQLTSAGASDIFILKLNNSGNFLWAKNFGDTSYDDGRSSAVDPFGNIYITGSFQETVDFTHGTQKFKLTALASTSMFILKLDSSGNSIWAQNIGQNGYAFGNSLSLRANGDLYSTGKFGKTADFDPGSDAFNLFDNNSSGDIFVLKLSQPTAGMVENDNTTNIKIYPNPTNNSVNIDIQKQIDKVNIEIYNSIGELIAKQSLVKGQNIIELSNQANGLYFIKVISENKIIATPRIIKQ